MNLYVFYITAAVAVLSTLMAVTRREMIHAVVYLIISFFSLGLIFYIMGAPLIAVLEVLIYAGAIMVLFLFIVMMLEMGTPKRTEPFWRTWGPGALMSLVLLFSTSVLFIASPESGGMPNAPFISPRQFGVALYTRYMLGVEVISLLLLFALVGALYLGRRD